MRGIGCPYLTTSIPNHVALYRTVYRHTVLYRIVPHSTAPHHTVIPQVLQLEMERLSLGKAAKSDRTAAARLATLDSELTRLKGEQAQITGQWEGERSEMMKVKVCVRGGEEG